MLFKKHKDKSAEFIARIKAYGDEMCEAKQTIIYAGKIAKVGKNEKIPEEFWREESK